MNSYDGRTSQGGIGPATGPATGASGATPFIHPPSPSSGEPPKPQLSELARELREPWGNGAIKTADLIYAVDSATGEHCGVFYGDPAIESVPIDPNRPSSGPAIVIVDVDRDSDDLVCLAAAVDRIKGTCSFVGDLRRILSQPETVSDLEIADIIYAIDGATNERCGLFFGDPATESLPIYYFRPWLAPVVAEVTVNRLSDDREVLAEAVRRIKGSCCYSGDEETTPS